MKRILVTGALGQIGSELVPALRSVYGEDSVVASDLRSAPAGAAREPFVSLDCTDAAALAGLVRERRIEVIYHLAAVLSATAEKIPQKAYEVNLGTLMNVLEVAREHGCAVFMPSSIGAFGPSTPRDPAPQDTIQRPTTMYGMTKVAGELLCDYYFRRYSVDTRGVRYPGLISYVSPPGGGTTDYAVDIFYAALTHGKYTCFLAPTTQLDMMYMPDAIRAAIELMEADPSRLKHRNAFNIASMQLTPAFLAGAISRYLSRFSVDYEIDFARQAIADSWPRRVDDSAARAEWGWQPRFDLATMTADMLEHLSARLGQPLPKPSSDREL